MNLTTLEWLAIANLMLNVLIVPIALFLWRMSNAIVRMEQTIVGHEQRITRTESTIDGAARQGGIDRRKTSR